MTENINQNTQDNENKPRRRVNTGLISLEIAASMNNIQIDMQAVVREYGIDTEDVSPEELIRIARGYGFKIKKKNIKIADILPKYPLPAIVQMKEDDTYKVVLAIKPEEDKLLVLTPLQNQPELKLISEFQEQIKDEMLILKHKILADEAKFGFIWFFNEIIKYKKIVGQVMLGSFVIQLFGLVTPLFTQVILDKVLVHRTISTLNVLGFAFLTVALFEFILNIYCSFNLDKGIIFAF